MECDGQRRSGRSACHRWIIFSGSDFVKSTKETRRRNAWWRFAWSIVILDPSFQMFSKKGPWHIFGSITGVIALGMAIGSIIQMARLSGSEQPK